MTTADMRHYWPNPAHGTQLIVQDATDAFGPIGHFSILRRYRQGGTINGSFVVSLDEYLADQFLSSWKYRFDPVHGMIEVSNSFPGVLQIYKPGKWIPWGGVMSVGDVLSQGLEADPAQGYGVIVGMGNYGWQSLEFETFHPQFTNAGGLDFENVVQILVMQSWCTTNACNFPGGQNVFQIRYWLAPATGAIQTEYILPTHRIDYAKSVTETIALPMVAA